MPRVGLEPTILVTELAKTFRILDGATTVTGDVKFTGRKNKHKKKPAAALLDVTKEGDRKANAK
jgi:hypothetical protein